MIHDENVLIRICGAGFLQTQQRVKLNIIPVTEIIYPVTAAAAKAFSLKIRA
jgi:hypothetical protein